MAKVRALNDFKQLLQRVLEGNEDSLVGRGVTRYAQPKIYLIESTRSVSAAGLPAGTWEPFDRQGWYALQDSEHAEKLFLDASHPRVWRLFSLLDAGVSDGLVDEWLATGHGLDRCWLSRGQLLAWQKLSAWHQRGVGLRFDDGLAPEDDASNFSLKAWHGSKRLLEGLDDLLEKAKQEFAIYSARWQKRVGGSTVLSAEIYSDGKITINRSSDVDEVLSFSLAAGDRYAQSLADATAAQRETLAPFELEFSQQIDLDSFAETVSKALSPMKLWLAEVESSEDFRRFRGVDLHTWDRIFLDVAPDFAYLTVPGKGCVNAAPRLAAIQGENNAGKTKIFHNGEEIFA